jgi:hypothetical protein
MKKSACPKKIWIILGLLTLYGCKRNQTKILESYTNAQELSVFVTEQPLKFYADHFLFLNKKSDWNGKHIYNCFAIEWAMNEVYEAAKAFYETDQLVRPTLESVPAGQLDRYQRLIKTYQSLGKGFFRGFESNETQKIIELFPKALKVFKKYNGEDLNTENFEQKFSKLAAYPLYQSLKNSIVEGTFEPQQTMLQMCQTLSFLTLTNSLYAVANTKFDDSSFSTPLTNPRDIKLETHCRAATLLSPYTSFVPFMHSTEGVFTENGFLNQYSSLSSFLGLSPIYFGFDNYPNGDKTPKIDGQIMSPIDFWNHDIVHSSQLLAGLGFVFFDFDGNLRPVATRLAILEGIQNYKEHLIKIAELSLGSDFKDFIKFVFFVTHEARVTKSNLPIDRHNSKYEGTKDHFVAQKSSYTPMHPCVIKDFESKDLSFISLQNLKEEFGISELKANKFLKDLKIWSAKVCPQKTNSDEAIYDTAWIETVKKSPAGK